MMGIASLHPSYNLSEGGPRANARPRIWARIAIRPSAPTSAGNDAMKAVYIEKHGGPEVLTYGDVPDPVAGPGEVVVDIFAASINGADWKVRSGSSYRA